MLKHYLPLAIAPLALILWGLFGATELTAGSFRSFVNYQTPYGGQAAPGKEREALTNRVVLIIADGLRHDVSQNMPNLNALRAKGAERVMRVGLPSLSLPGWTVIGAGAWQEQHGQTTNFGTCREQQDGKPVTALCPARVESVFAAAKRKGLTTALAGSPVWVRLYPDQFDMVFTAPHPADAHHDVAGVRAQNDAIEANALKLLVEKQPDLTLVYFTNPDDAWHGYGVFGEQGKEAVQDIDARVGRILAAIDLNATAVLFTSDHGHVDQGGHGGPEETVMNVPFIAAGKNIQPGKYELARQADIAPTIAVLLGTSFPVDNQGDPLFDMLVMPTSVQAQRSVDWAEQITARYDRIAEVIGVGSVAHRKLEEAQTWLAAGSDEAAITAAQAEVKTTREAVFAFREGRLLQERLLRTPALLFFVLPVALYAWFMRRMNWEFKRPLFGALAYFVFYYALFFGRGGFFSLSVFNEDDQIMSWFAARTLDAIIALAGAAVVLGALSRDEYKVWTLLNVFNMCYLVASALWLQVCVFYWLYDFAWTWFLPDPTWGFKYYLDALQTGAFMVVFRGIPVPVILILPLIALGVKWVGEKAAVRIRVGGSGLVCWLVVGLI